MANGGHDFSLLVKGVEKGLIFAQGCSAICPSFLLSAQLRVDFPLEWSPVSFDKSNLIKFYYNLISFFYGREDLDMITLLVRWHGDLRERRSKAVKRHHGDEGWTWMIFNL